MSDGEESEETGGANLGSPSSVDPKSGGGSTTAKDKSRWGGGAPSSSSSRAMRAEGIGLFSVQGDDPSRFDPEAVRALLSAIDRDIIPALENAMPARERRAADLLQSDVDAFLTLLLQQDYAETVAYLEDLRQRPIPLMVLFTDLMGPVARELGNMWLTDKCSFVEVTVGVSHLQRLVRDMSPLYQSDIPESPVAGALLLATVSGEQHTFGLSLLGEIFRRAGWTVTEVPQHSREQFHTLLQSENYDLYGFSLSCTDLADSLKADIDLVRQTASGASGKVIVGGPAFVEDPDIIKSMPVDGYAHDASGALTLAEDLMARMKGI